MEGEDIATASTASSSSQGATASDIKHADIENEFYNTGRIGRRNALPDILGYNSCTTTTADLPERLSALTTNDDYSSSSSSSNNNNMIMMINRDQPSTSQACINNSQQIGSTSQQQSTPGSSGNAMNNT